MNTDRIRLNASYKALYGCIQRFIPIIVAVIAMALTQACGGKGGSGKDDRDTLATTLPDTLRVVTLYSPTSFFIYREQRMGYDYDLVRRMAEDKSMTIDLQIAPSLGSAIAMLDSGYTDLIAYEVPVTAEYRDHILPVGPENITHQVLVQPKQRNGEHISDVTQLIGREVYVEKGSKYHARLNNLNTELGGGIIIRPIDRDTLITEDLIAMVSRGEIPLTIVDSDIARLNRTYYRDLDVSLQVSFPQRSSWGVAPGRQWLADSINAWFAQEAPQRAQAEILKRYFEMSKGELSIYTIDLNHGRISTYDHLFKTTAKEIDWDWRLLAAMAFTESRFDPTVVSWAGARGIMQIMPATARAYGLRVEQLLDNALCIATAGKILSNLDKMLSDKVTDPKERLKFVIAAYNSGPAHILDAIALAEKHGMNPQKWHDNVEHALLMKSKPEYYNDPVCRYGYFRGRQTAEYVRSVYEFYDLVRQKIK